MDATEQKKSDEIKAGQGLISTALFSPYYDHGGITIYHGDCRQIVPNLGMFDLLLTDPPYGIKRFEKGFGTTRFKGHGAEKDGITWDKTPEPWILEMLMGAAEKSIVWGANNFTLPPSEYFLVWDKEQTVDNFASAELAFTNLKRPAKVFRHSIHKHNQTTKHHPTQKPLELMQWCIGLAGDVDTILDPFAGSGTTGEAAKHLGKRAVLIEREEKYCEIAANRLSQEVLNF
jgi:DNA modification methylase